MTLRLLYLLFCQVLQWLALLTRSSAAKDAGLVRLLPRRAWRGLLVQPATLLRWHQDLVRRRWTYRHRRGRPAVAAGLRAVVLRLVRGQPSFLGPFASPVAWALGS